MDEVFVTRLKSKSQLIAFDSNMSFQFREALIKSTGTFIIPLHLFSLYFWATNGGSAPTHIMAPQPIRVTYASA